MARKNTRQAIRPLHDKKTSQHQAAIIFACIILKAKFAHPLSNNPKMCSTNKISHPALPLSPDPRLKYILITVILPLILNSIDYTDYTYPVCINKITAAVMSPPRNSGNKIPRYKSKKHKRDHGRSLGLAESLAKVPLSFHPQSTSVF